MADLLRLGLGHPLFRSKAQAGDRDSVVLHRQMSGIGAAATIFGSASRIWKCGMGDPTPRYDGVIDIKDVN